MAAEVFNKGNRPQESITSKMDLYFPAAIAITTTIAANVISNVTLTVPFQFKGAGVIEVSLPPNDALDAGLSLGSATLLAPASGSYSAGNHPRVNVQVINNTTAAITTAAAHDLILIML